MGASARTLQLGCWPRRTLKHAGLAPRYSERTAFSNTEWGRP